MTDYTKLGQIVDSNADVILDMEDKDRHDYECCIHAAMEHFGIK